MSGVWSDSGGIYKPFGDAMRIIDLERTLHVFVEPSIQAWAQNKHWLMDVADWTYLNGHFLVTLAALAWIYMRRNASFYFVRNMFMISMALALVGYGVFPTAPPRLMPEWGFTDSISQFLLGSTQHIDSGPGSAFLNIYAAVPSMHVCFAVMIGWSMSRLVSRRPAEVAWCLYPLLVDVRGRRHRQPLPRRRVPRRDDRGHRGAAVKATARPRPARRLDLRSRYGVTILSIVPTVNIARKRS